jgi:hypothetical protein
MRSIGETALDAAHEALRGVVRLMPHLASVAAHVRIEVGHTDTAGVFASGRMLVRPEWFLSLELPTRRFVVAHELLHLALSSHARAGRFPQLFNIAHDLIINDLLRPTFGFVPEQAIQWEGASRFSAEQLLCQLGALGHLHSSSWGLTSAEASAPAGALALALGRAGLAPAPASGPRGDVLDDALERRLFGVSADEQRRAQARLAGPALRCAAGVEVYQRMDHVWTTARGLGTEGKVETFEVLKGTYVTPWQRLLQRWFDGAAPSQRTYARANRRGSHGDVVLAGRRHEGWTLPIVLDTSNSMKHLLSSSLGAIESFGRAAGVSLVRIIECDTQVQRDTVHDLHELTSMELTGLGGSNLTPAFELLGSDPRVTGAVVLTDGDVELPGADPPFDVLWALVFSEFAAHSYEPPADYGTTVCIFDHLRENGP